MRNLIRFIIKNHFVILFIFLWIFSFFLLVQNNKFHRARFLNAVQRIDGSFHQFNYRFKQYKYLREENERLVNENLRLRYLISNTGDVLPADFTISKDSLFSEKYKYLPARVINNSTNKQYNYITLNKGENAGLKKEMGVISPDGVVGLIRNTSDNFSVVLSLLNRDFRVSAKIKNSNFFGPLLWEGVNYQYASLKEIPIHAQINSGDTVVTSGFSTVFPENIVIGYVESYKIEGGNYFNVKVKLATDFKKLSNVYVVDYNLREEQKKIEDIN